MNGASKTESLEKLKFENVASKKVEEISKGSYQLKSEREIQSSGYVIHTLEAALWSFYRTNSFREAILTAVNLGGDADSTGAVCGQIAGAFYGMKEIPSEWLDRLSKRELIESMAEKLIDRTSIA